ncbi:MAG: glycosyltransferase family 92 protein, partial [Anaerolineae bacterium]|nr:glycosyltransferase family 92 protein [Anaerolineae bacterium]
MDYLSLCLICKDENDYLPEWLDYHILMGVDRFYIYDNESKISLRDTLADYITRGWVVLMDIGGRGAQIFAYDHCLQTYGANTRWMGFIDTDEFLVPKNALKLPELLKDYEAYGGLAVSSIFFGSGQNEGRPQGGQITGYTWATHPTFFENNMIKSIVQPSKTLLPNSPHDFLYKDNHWCVNERFLRVDYQRFPNHVEKIQLNHYFCRSKSEIRQKLNRGRGDDGSAWNINRFETVNSLAIYQDETIINNLHQLFYQSEMHAAEKHDLLTANYLLNKMADLVHDKEASPITFTV